MKIKKGDTVEVIAGKDKGKRGEVLRVIPKENRVVVQGVAVRKKHKKAAQNQQGRQGAPQIMEFDAPIHASNVMIVDPKTNKPTRVGYKREGDQWVRFAKQSGELLDK
ncbi:MAG: 50S ribosomal protein L24 [Anaerolineales bacterium]